MPRCFAAVSLLAACATSVVLVSGPAPLRAQAAQSSTASAETLARSLQQHYDMIRDFKATFEQTTGGGPLNVSSKGEGTVEVKKPGRMRWVYHKPDKSLLVSDGVHIYNCFLDTKQPECDPPAAVPSGDDAPSAALFLAGKGDILRDFKVSRVESPVRNTLALRLDPRKADPDYEYLVVAFDPDTYLIRGLKTRDRQASDTTIVFNNIKTNTNIPDSTFKFTPPAGAKTSNKPR